jgi:DNA-binding HxlR family transcriptional regulator
MPRQRDHEPMNNGLAAALSVVGPSWTLLILQEIFRGNVRFEHINNQLRVARNIQTDRLTRLVARGVIEKVRYSDKPERFEYHLTEMGRDLYGVIIMLKAWGDKWVLGTPTPLIIHTPCGNPVSPAATCGHCAQELRFDDTHDGNPADE